MLLTGNIIRYCRSELGTPLLKLDDLPAPGVRIWAVYNIFRVMFARNVNETVKFCQKNENNKRELCTEENNRVWPPRVIEHAQ